MDGIGHRWPDFSARFGCGALDLERGQVETRFVFRLHRCRLRYQFPNEETSAFAAMFRLSGALSHESTLMSYATTLSLENTPQTSSTIYAAREHHSAVTHHRNSTAPMQPKSSTCLNSNCWYFSLFA